MHDGRRSRPENDGRRLAIEVEEARVRGTLAATDLGLASSNLGVIPAHGLDDGVIAGNFRGLRVVADKTHLRRMILHPGIFRRRLRDMLNKAALDAFMVLTRHR